jgi:hypothetical protein
MKKNVAMKWIEALRSGEYKQGDEAILKNKIGYCCLGVLAEISPCTVKKDGDNEYPSKEVVKWAGLKSRSGQIENTSLATLNDVGFNDRRSERFTFDEIADIIQVEYEDL